MSRVEFVIGGAGSGKSDTVFKRLDGILDGDPLAEAYLIVPDQFVGSAEGMLVDRLNAPGFLGRRVLTFMNVLRLICRRMELNYPPPPFQLEKLLLIREVVSARELRLEYFSRVKYHDGFIEGIASLIRELKENLILPEEFAEILDGASAGMNETNRMRFAELAAIYKGYQALLDSRGMLDREDQVHEIETYIESGVPGIEGATFFIDGFAGFSGWQLRLLRLLVRAGATLTIALCLDEEVKGNPTFTQTRETLRILEREFKELETDAPKLSRQHLKGNHRALRESKDLAELERVLRKGIEPRFTGDGSLALIEAAGPREELESIARDILRRLDGDPAARWSDFAVVCRDIQGVKPLAEEIFGRFEIPLWIDASRELIDHPLMQLALSAISVVFRGRFTRIDVLACLRTLDLTEDDSTRLHVLDLYTARFGVDSRRRWQEEWSLPTHEGEEAEENPERQVFKGLALSELNSFRDRMLAPLHELAESCARARDFAAFAGALRNLIMALDQLAPNEAWPDAPQIPQKSLETLLERIERLMGARTCSLMDFKSVLRQGIASLALPTAPPAGDAVLLTDLFRSRIPEIDVVYVPGLVEEVFPRSFKRGMFFTEEEKEGFDDIKRGNVLTPEERKREAEDYLFYIACTRPTKALVLSTYINQAQDKPAVRSVFLERMTVPELNEDVAPLSGVDLARETALIGDGLTDGAFDELCNKASPELARRVLSVYRGGTTARIAPQKIDLALGEIARYSASRLETFAGCAFRWFATTLLGLEERETFSLDVREKGLVSHQALELLYRENPPAELRADDGVLENTLRETARRSVDELHGPEFMADPRRAHFVYSIADKLAEFVRLDLEAMAVTGYQPRVDLPEATFGKLGDSMKTFELRSGERTVSIRGKIDRVDASDGDPSRCVVFDYKSSPRKTKSVAGLIAAGLDLQMGFYLLAAKEFFRLEPLGGFYYLNQSNPTKGGSRLAERAGLRLEPSEGFAGSELEKKHPPLAREEMRDVLEACRVAVFEWDAAIRKGLYSAEPLDRGGKLDCEYCQAASLCRFREERHPVRRLNDEV